MKTHPFLFVPLAALLLTWPAQTTPAAPLVLNNVSAAEAAERLSANYGVDLVLKTNGGRHLRVALEDAGDMSARLQTINALANALGVDFTKTFIVTKAASGHARPAVLDTGVSIPFGRTTLPTREAIALVAGVDAANAQIAEGIDGVVTLSSPTLTAARAAQEIAAQTKTSWKTIYVLAPRPVGIASLEDLPMIVFPNRQREAQERRVAEAEQKADQEQAAAYQQALIKQEAALQVASRQAPANFQAMNTQGMNAQAMNGYYSNGYYPNGYAASSYGNNGYGNNGYGGTNGYSPAAVSGAASSAATSIGSYSIGWGN